MSSKFLNISTDENLGGDNPSDSVVSAQKAVKAYIDNNVPDVQAFTASEVETIWENVNG